MASRLSTPSEGEIVESGSEKAIPSQPSVNGKSVDRPSRTRSPSPRRRDYRARSRSRSPYRESRGSKRPREDDHYSRRDREDPRSFKIHYEGRRGDNDRYKDYDRGGNSVTSLRYDDRHGGRSRDKRQRTVSRSPPRFNDRRGDHRRSGKDKLANRGGKPSKAQSVSEEQGKDPASTVSLKADAEQTQYQTDRDRLTIDKVQDSADIADKPSTETPDESLDEAALIEIRRKRREAIKAKHRGQANPLMVQALNISNTTTPSVSNSATPNDVPVTPSETPPASPRELSGPNSPSAFQVSKDADLANVQKSTEEDGPSAADYDPTMDMQEDRMRQVSHQQQNEVPAKEYVETVNEKKDVLLPVKPKDDFDMFADDDMFAAEAPTPPRPGKETAEAVPVPKSKAIDMSMLDDWDDPEGYYKVILGELLDNRYHVQSNLGRGMFSAVVRAKDQITNRLVAIKIIRANDTMRKAALKEIDILQVLKEADPEDKKHMIRLERYFEHKGHLCMIFEHLSINLREVLKKFGRDVGINLKAVRAYAQQMFLGLSLLRRCNILHADLKPDNVLVNDSRNTLKICDLGSASDASDNEITPYLVSRFYRAPEIILGMPYDFAIDTWSIGCTLFELYTGKILFTGRTNNQMLRGIMECRGKFSHKALRKAEFAHLHFDDLLNFRSVEKDKVTGKDTVRILNFTKPTRDLRARLMSNTKGLADVDMKELNLFIDLLEKCLVLNPEKRCTPTEALKHPFIMRNKV